MQRQHEDDVKVTTYLTKSEAHALAQFVKRAGFTDARTNAVNDDEAYMMIHVIVRLQEGLEEAGFAPR